jgi:hypothetical protein
MVARGTSPANQYTKFLVFATFAIHRPLRMRGGLLEALFSAHCAACTMLTGLFLQKASSTFRSSAPPFLVTTTLVKPSGAIECPGFTFPEGLRFWISCACFTLLVAMRCPPSPLAVSTEAKIGGALGLLAPGNLSTGAGCYASLSVVRLGQG